MTTDHRVEGRQAPEYGEYAPEGWVNPVAQPTEETPARDPAPTTPPPSPPRSEVAGPGAGYDAPPPSGQPVPGAPPRAIRHASFNRFATWILLAYGVYDVVRGALQANVFADTYSRSFESLGYLSGTFESASALGLVGTVSAIASVPIFLLTALWAVRRLRRGRVSWVLLLVTGLAVNLATGIAVVVVVMNDPSYVGALPGG